MSTEQIKPPFTYCTDTGRTEVLWSNRPFPVTQPDLFSEEASA